VRYLMRKTEVHQVSQKHKAASQLLRQLYDYSHSTEKKHGCYFDTLALATVSLNVLPALNFASFFALILMVAPVCGLRPLRAARSDIENEPTSMSVTGSPFFRELLTDPVKLLSAFSACTLVMPASEASFPMMSALFIIDFI